MDTTARSMQTKIEKEGDGKKHTQYVKVDTKNQEAGIYFTPSKAFIAKKTKAKDRELKLTKEPMFVYKAVISTPKM